MEKLAVINGVDVELEVVDNAVYTTSLSVAEVFNKNHKNIIRKINEFPKDNFTKLNFELSKYIDSTGRILPCYKITRDAFSLLVMGFTGEKAYKWKIEFIKAFNEMEKRLRNIEYEKHDNLPTFSKVSISLLSLTISFFIFKFHVIFKICIVLLYSF